MNGSVAGHVWLLLIIAIIGLMTLIAWVLKSKNKTLMGIGNPSIANKNNANKSNANKNNAHKNIADINRKLFSKLSGSANYKAKAKSTTKSASQSKTQTNRDILRLDKRLKKYFPSLNTRLQHNRIIAKDGANKFMLTIDKKVSKGGRQLGDARVINFHSLPSVSELQQLFDTYTNKPTT